MNFWKNKYIYNFQQFGTVRSFAKNIDAYEDQSKLLDQIMNFKKNTKPKNQEKKVLINLTVGSRNMIKLSKNVSL